MGKLHWKDLFTINFVVCVSQGEVLFAAELVSCLGGEMVAAGDLHETDLSCHRHFTGYE